MSKKTRETHENAVRAAITRLQQEAEPKASTQLQPYDFDSLLPEEVAGTVLALGFSEDEYHAWFDADPQRVLSSEEQASFLKKLTERLPNVTGGRRLMHAGFGWGNDEISLSLSSGRCHVPNAKPYRTYSYIIDGKSTLSYDEDADSQVEQITNLKISIMIAQKEHLGSHGRLQDEPRRSIELPGDDGKITIGAIQETMRMLTHVRNFSDPKQFPPLQTSRR